MPNESATSARTASPPARGDAREAGRYKAPALDKGLDILELLADEKDGLPRKEIAERLGRSIHELFRMMYCLEQRGYIVQDPGTDNMVLSRKLFELGLRHPPSERLIAAAEPILYELSRTIHQGCHITVPSHNAMLVVAKQDSSANLSVTVRLGTRVPFHTSVSGIVYLAHLSEAQRADLLANCESTAAELDHATRAIALARKQGYLIQQSKIARGVTEISVPIFGHTGRVVATLSAPILSITTEKPDIAQIRRSFLEAAGRITQAIGGIAAGTG